MKHIYTLEAWRNVEGYEGLYQVSNFGKVRSLITNRILKPFQTKDGYLRIKLSKDGNKKMFYIHRLVATAFLSNEEELPEIDHINNDRSDNRVANLQWISHVENLRKKESDWGVPRKVQCIETGQIFDSVSAAAKAMKRDKSTMSDHLRGKTQSCAKKHFKYYND